MSAAGDGQLRSIAEAVREATQYDHVADFAHPQGQTLCVCEDCRRVFRGHPSRNLCRVHTREVTRAKAA